MKKRVLAILLTMALLCGMMPLGTVVAETGLLGDVDGNGTVDSTDARLILQYAVENIAKFPIE